MYKQVIVLRKDLNMRKGKMVAQGAHASMGAILSIAKNEVEGSLTIPLLDEHGKLSPAGSWLLGKFKKICVSVDSEREMLELQTKAKKLGIINCLITDAGLTEFGGVPTITALALGPDESEKIDKISSHLKLL